MHNEAKKYLKIFLLLLFSLPHPKALLQTYVKESNSNQVCFQELHFCLKDFKLDYVLEADPKKLQNL